MDLNMQWHHETRGKKTVAELIKKGFNAVYFPNRASAAAYLISLVPDGASVGFGGSMTIREMGIRQMLVLKGCTLLDHHKEGLTLEESMVVRRAQLTADIFVCSSNAVTMQGEMVNVDGAGNRVAAMGFGPGRIIIAIGVNKLVNTLDEAYTRIKTVAGPVNNKRRNSSNPCVKSGECMNCQGKGRICNITTIISRCPRLSEVHVLVIGEELGY